MNYELRRMGVIHDELRIRAKRRVKKFGVGF